MFVMQKRTLIGGLIAAFVVGSAVVFVIVHEKYNSSIAETPYKIAGAAEARGDYATARSIWQPLADQGAARAQANLGVSYALGEGVPQDYVEAMKWFRLAADQGDANAQYNIGVLYQEGDGVPQNCAEAVKWYRLAADQGYGRAQVSLGLMYDKGHGVPQNYVQAHDKEDRDKAASNPERAANKMTPEQIAEAQKLASKWKPSAGR